MSSIQEEVVYSSWEHVQGVLTKGDRAICTRVRDVLVDSSDIPHCMFILFMVLRKLPNIREYYYHFSSSVQTSKSMHDAYL